MTFGLESLFFRIKMGVNPTKHFFFVKRIFIFFVCCYQAYRFYGKFISVLCYQHSTTLNSKNRKNRKTKFGRIDSRCLFTFGCLALKSKWRIQKIHVESTNLIHLLGQFHQHFMSSFCAIFHSPKFKSKL